MKSQEKPYGIIYLITNNINGKGYVGQTIQTIEARWRGHISNARKNSESVIHKSMRKYGTDNFVIEEICKAFNQEELDIQEQYWIFELNTHFNNGKGYNMTWGGEGAGWEAVNNHPNIKEIIKKHTENLKLYYFIHPEAREKAKQKTIEQFSNPEMRELFRKNSIRQFSDPEMRKKDSEAKKKYYAETPGARERASKIRSVAYEKQRLDPNFKGWICTDPHGKEYITKNLGKFCNEHGLVQTGMSHVAHGDYKTSHGWKCRKEE